MSIEFDALKYEKKFAGLCEQLVIAEYPNAKPIDGQGGDSGIDTFVGELNGDFMVFQFKYFTGKLTSARKKKIEESLETASKLNLNTWILLVPLNFSPSAQKWFDGLKEHYGFKIDYWPKGKLISLLLKHQNIRKEYFPDTDLQIKTITRLLIDKKIISGTPKVALLKDLEEIRDMINADMSPYRIELQTRKDGISYTIHPEIDDDAIPPLTMSFKFVFPNDKAGKKAAKELADFFKKGKATQVDGKFIKEFKADPNVFFELDNQKLAHIKVGPAAATLQLPIKLIAVMSDAKDNVSLDYVQLRCVRAGTEEAEFSNIGQQTPLTLSLMIRAKNKSGNFTFNFRHEGFSPSAVYSCARFLRSLSEAKSVKLIHLELNRPFGEFHLSSSNLPQIPDGWIHFLETLVEVEQAMRLSFVLPAEITDEDRVAVHALKDIIQAGRVVNKGEISFKLSLEGARSLLSTREKSEKATVKFNSSDSYVHLFGEEIPLGPTETILSEATVLQSQAEISAFVENAQPGETIKITLEPKNREFIINYIDWPKKEKS